MCHLQAELMAHVHADGICSCLMSGVVLAPCMQGIPAAAISRFNTWQIDTRHVYIYSPSEESAADHPAALRSTLQQLSRLPAPAGAVLQFGHWEWTAELAQTMAALLPGLSHYTIRVDVSELSDEMLSLLLHMGPCVSRVGFDEPEREGVADYSGLAMSWQEMTIERLDTDTLIRLPDPTSLTTPLLLKATYVHLGGKCAMTEVSCLHEHTIQNATYGCLELCTSQAHPSQPLQVVQSRTSYIGVAQSTSCMRARPNLPVLVLTRSCSLCVPVPARRSGCNAP